MLNPTGDVRATERRLNGDVVDEQTGPVCGVDDVIDFVGEVAGDLRGALSDWLVAVYLHGSAALSDFDSLLSDIDLLVVMDDNAPTNAVRSIGNVLHSQQQCAARRH